MIDTATQTSSMDDPGAALNLRLSWRFDWMPSLQSEWQQLVLEIKDFVGKHEHAELMTKTDLNEMLSDAIGGFHLLKMVYVARRESVEAASEAVHLKLESRQREEGERRMRRLEEFAESGRVEVDGHAEAWRPELQHIAQRTRGLYAGICRALDGLGQDS